MLDCDPPEVEDPSEAESGGVSTPELDDVQVLERERVAGLGREKTGMESWCSCQYTAYVALKKIATHKQRINPRHQRSNSFPPNSVFPRCLSWLGSFSLRQI